MKETEIKIQDKTYIVNIDKAFALGLITEKKLSIYYKVGNKFINNVTKNKYILADCCNDMVALINISSGDYYREPVKVYNICGVDELAFNLIVDGSHEFVEINSF